MSEVVTDYQLVETRSHRESLEEDARRSAEEHARIRRHLDAVRTAEASAAEAASGTRDRFEDALEDLVTRLVRSRVTDWSQSSPTTAGCSRAPSRRSFASGAFTASACDKERLPRAAALPSGRSSHCRARVAPMTRSRGVCVRCEPHRMRPGGSAGSASMQRSDELEHAADAL
jgi:hypothetical protein